MSDPMQSDVPPPSSMMGAAPEAGGFPAPQPPRLIVKALVGVLLAIIIVAGITVWWISHGGGPVRATCDHFIRDMAGGDFDAAKARCTSDVDFDHLAREVAGMKSWGTIRTLSLPAVSTSTAPDGRATAEVAGEVEFENLSKAFSASLIQQPDGSYRISAYHFE